MRKLYDAYTKEPFPLNLLYFSKWKEKLQDIWINLLMSVQASMKKRVNLRVYIILN